MRWEDLPTTPWRWLLTPAWLAWRPLVAARNAAYDLGWRPILRLPVPVLSVGNLAAGGTGKTPFTALLAERLRARGRRPAVLMRGYKGEDGANDEARLLDCPVVCDPDRVRGGTRAIADGADCLVLDDGFQHRRLHRDVDLVLIDALRPWGGGAVLPLGLLREGARGLRRADLAVITRSDQADPAALDGIAARLRRHGLASVRARHAPAALVPLQGGAGEPPQALAGRRVLLASGLGNPGGFERTVRDLGAAIVAHRRFPDHHRYSASEAAALVAEAAAAGAQLVVTAKDAVKLRPLGAVGAVLTVRMALDAEGDAALDALLARRCPVP